MSLLHKRSENGDWAQCHTHGASLTDVDADVTCYRCKDETARKERVARRDRAIDAAIADMGKVPELSTKRTESEEAPCPSCGHRNAMLNQRWVEHPRKVGHLVALMVCRDCNYVAWEGGWR